MLVKGKTVVKGMIAVLLGQADESYQQEYLKGVMSRAFELGYSVVCFSMYIKYQDTKEREIGDSNIFNLINYDSFDAVIVLSDTIQTPGLEARLEEEIHEQYKGPVICVDSESKYFHSFWTDGYASVYAEVSHLIEKHGLKDIAYLTGRKAHRHSIRRVEAYRDAMKEHDLPVDEKRIFTGDFWYTSGAGCAEKLLRKKESLPEAIVCANDCMAIGLADELTKHGIRIPEDIAIVGYGTSNEGQTCPRSLTSCYIPSEYYGSYSVELAISILEGKTGDDLPRPNFEPKLFYGESCGCEESLPDINLYKRTNWLLPSADEGYYSIHNTMLQDILGGDSLKEFMGAVYENLYQLKDIKRFAICLNDLWLFPEYMLEKDFPEMGYGNYIVNALSFDRENTDKLVIASSKTFDVKEMYPDFSREEPMGYIFTPIYHETISLGYAMVSYGDEPRSYDETYRLWISAVSRGLEGLHRTEIIQALKAKLAAVESIKFAGRSLGHGFDRSLAISDEELKEMDEVERILNENDFVYHFQPIVSAVDGSIYSYEALMRTGSSYKIPPLQILKQADRLGRLADIEKATFTNVLNVIEERRELLGDRKVFINSIPGSGIAQEDKDEICERLSHFPDLAVVELTEQEELKDEELESLKKIYRELGIGLAVDDYGTGYSNVSNLLRYMPDIVKIDRSLLTEIQSSSQKQHFVRDIIEFCHGNGILALAEGVETSEELKTVIRLGTDLIQGYYTGRPSEQFVTEISSKVQKEIINLHNALEEGIDEGDYIAGRVNRISLSTLIKENKSTVVIGNKDATFKDVTLVGTPGLRVRMNVEVLEGYEGRITLENVYLSNTKGRPCIDISDGANVSLRLVGNNRLVDGGIRVPEHSSLTVEGEGTLSIILDTNVGYGIGNSLDQAHGKLVFYQDGEVKITSSGKKIIGIGSGLGGPVSINKGKYEIRINADEGIGLGSLTGDNKMKLHDCAFGADLSVRKGVCIGSMEGSTEVESWDSYIECNGAGRNVTGVGSLFGRLAKVDVHDMSMVISVNSGNATGIGSSKGNTEFDMVASAFRFSGSGDEAYVFGGTSGDVAVHFIDSDVGMEIETVKGSIANAGNECVKVERGRYHVVVNGVET